MPKVFLAFVESSGTNQFCIGVTDSEEKAGGVIEKFCKQAGHKLHWSSTNKIGDVLGKNIRFHTEEWNVT